MLTNRGNSMFTYDGHSWNVYSLNIILTKDTNNIVKNIIMLNDPIKRW